MNSVTIHTQLHAVPTVLTAEREHVHLYQARGTATDTATPVLVLAFNGEPTQEVVRALAALQRAMDGLADAPTFVGGIPLAQAHDLITDVQLGRAVLVRPSKDDRTRSHVIARTGTRDEGTEKERPLVTMRQVDDQHAGLVARQAFESFGRARS